VGKTKVFLFFCVNEEAAFSVCMCTLSSRLQSR